MEALNFFIWLRGSNPNFNMTFHAFRSGAVMIDIITMDGIYVVEWSPKNPDEVGISNAKNATFGHEGSDEVFPSFEKVKVRLDQLLQNTVPPEEVHGDPRYS